MNMGGGGGNSMLNTSLQEMLADIDGYITTPKSFSFIHGDFCFSNIMFDFRSNRIKTYDPRGIDFSNVVTPYGDKRYDYAKIMHSLIGLYDFIISGFYECEIIESSIYFKIYEPQILLPLQQYFIELFCPTNPAEIYAITIHLFLSAIPLHADDKKRQDALFANAFRLYKLFKQNYTKGDIC